MTTINGPFVQKHISVEKFDIWYIGGGLIFLDESARRYTLVSFHECVIIISGEGPVRGEQVSQLWQRECAKLDTFSINVQHYLQNHARNWIFGHPMGASGASRAIYALYLKFLTQRNLVAEFHQENVSFTRKTAN